MYSFSIRSFLTTGNSGRFEAIFLTLSFSIISVGISVSTYILLAVGNGRKYWVFPSSCARLVSSGTPSSDCFARLIISSNALCAFVFSSATRINASSSSNSSMSLSVSTSS